MKLHLPLGLLNALLAVLALVPSYAKETIEAGNGAQSLNYGVQDNSSEEDKQNAEKKYEEGLDLTIEKGAVYDIDNPWTKIGGDSNIVVRGTFHHTAGQIAYGTGDKLTVSVDGGMFEILGYAREGAGKDAELKIDVTNGGDFEMRNGFLSCGGGHTVINVDKSSKFISNIGFVAHNGGSADIKVSGGYVATQTAEMGAAHADTPGMPKDAYGNEFCPSSEKTGTVNITVNEGGKWYDQSWYGWGQGMGYTGEANFTVTGEGSLFKMEKAITRSTVGFGEDGGVGKVDIKVEEAGQWVQEAGVVGLAQNGGTAEIKIAVSGNGSKYLMLGGDIGKYEGEGSSSTGTITLTDGGTFEMKGGKVWDHVTIKEEGGSFLHTGGTFEGKIELSAESQYSMQDGLFSGAVTLSGGSCFTQSGGTFSGTIAMDADSQYVLENGTLKADLNITAGTCTISNGRIEDAQTRSITVGVGGAVQQRWDTLGDEAGQVNIRIGGSSVARAMDKAEYELGGTAAFGGNAQVVVDENGLLKVTTKAAAVAKNCTLNVEVNAGGQILMDGSVNGGEITLNQGAYFSMNDSAAFLRGVTVNIKSGATLTATLGLLSSSTIHANGGRITLAEGTTVYGGSILLSDGEIEQAGTVEHATLVLSGGTYTQTGDTSAKKLQVSGGSYTQQGGSIRGGIEVDGAGRFTQDGSAKAERVQVDVSGEGTFEQNGQMTGATVNVSGGTFTQQGQIGGNINVSGGVYEQQGGVITGDVCVNGGSFDQSGTINGSLRVNGGGKHSQQGDVVGQVVVNGGVFTQESGDIDSGVQVVGGSATTKGNVDGGVSVRGGHFVQEGGTISGSITLNGSDSSFTQKDGATEADVLADRVVVANGASYTLEGGKLSLKGGKLSGGIEVRDKGSRFTQNGGSIAGQLFMYSGTSLMQHGGTIEKNITLYGSSVFTQEAGAVGMNGIFMESAGTFNEHGGTMHGVTYVGGISVLNMTAGTIDRLDMRNGGTVNQEGGLVADAQLMGGTYNLSGGELQQLTIGGEARNARLIMSKGGKLENAYVAGAGHVDYRGGMITGVVTLAGEAAGFTYYGGDLDSGASLVAQDATISAMADGMNASVVLRGSRAKLELNGHESHADITLEDGRIYGGGRFMGSLHVDTSASSLDMSGINTETIKGFHLRSSDSMLYDIESGDITLTDAASSLVVGRSGSGAFVRFQNEEGSTLRFAEGAKLVVNFDASLLKNIVGANSEEETKADVSFYLTNGNIVADDGIDSHLALGAGLGEGFDVSWEQEGDKIIAHVTLKGLVFASNYTNGLDADKDEGVFAGMNKAYLDADLTLNTGSGDTREIVLKQLSGEGESTLSVEGQRALVLRNSHASADERNGDTDVFGSIVANETKLVKDGDARLTVHGKVSALGGLEVRAGELRLQGGAEMRDLVVGRTGELVLDGVSKLGGTGNQVDGKVSGQTQLTLERAASLTMNTGSELTVGGITLEEEASLTVTSGVLNAAITPRDGTPINVSDGSRLEGDMILGKNARLTTAAHEVKGTISLNGEGAEWTAVGTTHTGDVTVSGKGAKVAMSGNAQVDGSVMIEGENAEVQLAGQVSGSVTLAGKGSGLDISGTTVQQGVTLRQGHITGANNFTGNITIDLNDGVGGEVKLTGVDGSLIQSVQMLGSTGVYFTGLAENSALKFSGDGNLVVVGTESVVSEDRDGGKAVFGFTSGGKLGFEQGGKLKLQLAQDLFDSLENGELRLRITNGTFDCGGDLLEWVKQHFLLATGSGLSFLAKEFADASEAGEIVLGLVRDTSLSGVKEANTETLAGASQVIVQDNLSVTTAGPTMVRQLTGSGNVTIDGQDDVTFENVSYDYYNGDTDFVGNITARNGANFVKSGNAKLAVGGNVVTVGQLTVEEGTLALYGADNSVGKLLLGEKGATLVVEGALSITESSRLTGGTLSGDGVIKVQKELTLAGVTMDSAPSVDVAAGAVLKLEQEHAAMGALSGSGKLEFGTTGATLSLTKNVGVFSGEITGQGTIELQGGVDQTFVGLRNENLTIRSSDERTRLTLRGETCIESLETLGELVIEGHVTTSKGDLTNNTTRFAMQFGSNQNMTKMTVQGEDGVKLGSTTLLAVDAAAGSGGFANGDLNVLLVVAGTEGGIRMVDGEESTALYDGDQVLNVQFSAFLEYFYDDLAVEAVYIGDEERESGVSLLAEAELKDEPASPERREANALKATGKESFKGDVIYSAANTYNSRSGAKMLSSLLKRAADSSSKPSEVGTAVGTSQNFTAIAAAIKEAINMRRMAEAERLISAAAGSTITAPGAALRDEVRDELVRVRDHALQVESSEEARHGVSAWIAAEGGFRELETDGDESGYKLNAWGGSVGADKRIRQNTVVGLSLTALYGDLDASSADMASGSLDSYWLSMYMRTSSKAWSHGLVVSVGMASADLDRTVSYDGGAYRTSGSTDGYGVGLLYELGYDVTLNESNTQKLRPYFTVAAMYSSLSGWSEDVDGGLGLNVEDQDSTMARVGAGVRWMADLDTKATGGATRLVLGVGVAQDIGDKRAEADVAFREAPETRSTIRGVEPGSTSLQLDASFCVPVGRAKLIYLNGHGDVRDGASSWSVGAGFRCVF